MSLWDQSYGQVGAMLKILGNHGVVPEELECLRQDPDRIGKAVAAELKKEVIKSTLVYCGPINMGNLGRLKMSDIVNGCGLTNVTKDDFEQMDKEEILKDPSIILKFQESRQVWAGVFKFYTFQFERVSPLKRWDKITSIMRNSGYLPAPTRLMFIYLRLCLETQTPRDYKALIGRMRLNPLISMDPFDRHDTGLRSICNTVMNFMNPKLEIGRVDLFRDEKIDPSKFLYFGFRNE